MEAEDLHELAYLYHPVLKVIMCEICKGGVFPSEVKTHFQTHGYGDPTNCADKILTKYALNSPDMVNAALPEPFGLPIEGIHVFSGFACTHCGHAGRNSRTIANHWMRSHRDIEMAVPLRSRTCSVQCIWNNYATHNKVLAVDPTLRPHATLTAYERFLQLHPPTVPAFSTLDSDTSNHHPLLRITNWHLHLEPFMSNSQDLSEIVKLCEPPSDKDTLLDNLGKVARSYFEDGEKKLSQASYLIRRMLHGYPLYGFLFLFFHF